MFSYSLFLCLSFVSIYSLLTTLCRNMSSKRPIGARDTSQSLSGSQAQSHHSQPSLRPGDLRRLEASRRRSVISPSNLLSLLLWTTGQRVNSSLTLHLCRCLRSLSFRDHLRFGLSFDHHHHHRLSLLRLSHLLLSLLRLSLLLHLSLLRLSLLLLLSLLKLLRKLLRPHRVENWTRMAYGGFWCIFFLCFDY